MLQGRLQGGRWKVDLPPSRLKPRRHGVLDGVVLHTRMLAVLHPNGCSLAVDNGVARNSDVVHRGACKKKPFQRQMDSGRGFSVPVHREAVQYGSAGREAGTMYMGMQRYGYVINVTKVHVDVWKGNRL